jgi:hypothetical protein
MDYKNLLEKYEHKGHFLFEPQESLKQNGNAPSDKGGVYLIYKLEGSIEILVYIGSSGQRNKLGELKIRQGGLYDRLINGYHPNRFGESKRIKRYKAFPQHMIKSGISKIIIYWWVTFDKGNTDFPTDIEKK